MALSCVCPYPGSLRSCPPERTPGPRTHSPTTLRPSARDASTGSTQVPDSEGPKESITLATIWRDAHNPHARSGGSTALSWRRVRLLTVAAHGLESSHARVHP